MLKSKKSVRFSDFCRVVLIPQRQEYSAAGLSASMWWSKRDYGVFKQGYLCDLQRSKSINSVSSTNLPSSEPLVQRTNTILVVSDSPHMTASLTAKLSSIIPKVTQFVDCKHEDVHKILATGRTFSAVVIDGTRNSLESHHEETPFFIDTIRSVRSVQESGLKITVFVDSDAMPSAPVSQLISETNIENSDLIFLTADCWTNFRGMIESAEVAGKC